MCELRAPDQRGALESELSERSRALLAKESDPLNGAIQLKELSLISSQGGLMVERISDYRMIYMENPNKTVVRTGLITELAWAIDAITRYTVLDDLAKL